MGESTVAQVVISRSLRPSTESCLSPQDLWVCQLTGRLSGTVWRPLTTWRGLVEIHGKLLVKQNGLRKTPLGLLKVCDCLFAAAPIPSPTPWGMGNFTALRIAPLGTWPFPFNFSKGDFQHNICFIHLWVYKTIALGRGTLLSLRVWALESACQGS